MKSAIIVTVALALVAPAAFAQGVDSKSAAADTTEGQPSLDRSADALRRAPPSANPFPYAVAVEPAREPYRPPVPCSTFARETDGSTTCIGVQDRAPHAPRAATSQKPQRPVRREQFVRREEPAPQRLTDPRYDLAPVAPVTAEPVLNDGNGLLAFLGRLLTR